MVSRHDYKDETKVLDDDVEARPIEPPQGDRFAGQQYIVVKGQRRVSRSAGLVIDNRSRRRIFFLSIKLSEEEAGRPLPQNIRRFGEMPRTALRLFVRPVDRLAQLRARQIAPNSAAVGINWLMSANTLGRRPGSTRGVPM